MSNIWQMKKILNKFAYIMKDMLLKLNYWKWYAYIGVWVLWQIACGIEQKIVVYYFEENKNNKVFSIVDIEKTNMDKWGDILPFYKNIKEEGVVLWKTA